ncbi:hypothetical protein [Nannocystis pusilla]|uniref:hypothetical protein n=1 Tax=Nannocystis pusilla TaxID=889268 RepID=UPI003B808704
MTARRTLSPLVVVPSVVVPSVVVPVVEVLSVEVPVVEVLSVEVLSVEVPVIEMPSVEVPVVGSGSLVLLVLAAVGSVGADVLPDVDEVIGVESLSEPVGSPPSVVVTLPPGQPASAKIQHPRLPSRVVVVFFF